jgi:hypothetical protein
MLAPLQAQWRDALEKAKANRTVFAQRRIKPDEVLPEWHKQQKALGTHADVSRFRRALACGWGHRWRSAASSLHASYRSTSPKSCANA